MTLVKRLGAWAALACALTLGGASPAGAQASRGTVDPGTVPHQVEARLMYKGGRASNVRVRLVRISGGTPAGDTITRPEGDARFTNLTEGDYYIVTYETDMFEATETKVSVFSPDRQAPRPTTQTVIIELPLKLPPAPPTPGVVRADVDHNVPKAAVKHYEAGMKALHAADSARAIKELRAAIEIYPDYYSARVELGRKLRLDRRFEEAAGLLSRLREIAPKKAEGRIEYGIVLLELGRREGATTELRAALESEEANWATHLYLGWALLEDQPAQAVPHFARALALDEQKAARAHLALARVAEQRGDRERAIQHLDAYLTLAPNAKDVESARKLAEQLRKTN
ncbi:MAG TPA: tetratricopeptide repeat protein [Pyrinomonadaceae bacterium]